MRYNNYDLYSTSVIHLESFISAPMQIILDRGSGIDP